MNNAGCNPIKARLTGLVLWLIGGTAAADLPAGELDARTAHANSPIAVESVVVDESGIPLAGVTIRAMNAAATSTLATAQTDSNGYFELSGLTRDNLLLELDAAGMRRSLSYVRLAQPVTMQTVSLDPLVLTPAMADEVRFRFAGDTAWVRRLYDTDIDGQTKLLAIPPSDPAALIDTADPLPGTRETVKFVTPYFAAADYGALNLETPALLTSPFTPHLEKDFGFFALPESLQVLPEMHVDYVALGNNHLYDYLDLGVADTLAALSSFAPSVAFSGAGSNESQANAAHRFDLNEHAYSMLSATSISGGTNGFSSDALLYVARDSLGKGGAADLGSSAFYDEIELEALAGRAAIAQLHTGEEYSFSPVAFSRNRMTDAADAGASLVIAHHPHVAQGVEFYGPEQTLLVHSLGNFVFDQQRLETMLGLTAQLDYAGTAFRRGRLDGVYLEDFRPRPIVAEQAATFMRRLNEFSTAAVVFPYNGQGWVQRDRSQTVQQDSTVDRTVQIGADGWVVVDLRGLLDNAAETLPIETSLISVNANADVTLRLGRDIMERHGEFEDFDVDDDGLGDLASTAGNSYAMRWDWSSSVDAKFVCWDRPYRGMAAACSTRGASNSSDTVVAFRNRIRVMRAETTNPIDPNLDLTLFGYARGDNAGPMRAEIKYYPSREAQVSFVPADGSPNETVALGSGSFDWRAFAHDLSLPPDNPVEYPDLNDPAVSNSDLKGYITTRTARALRVFLDHSPPASGDGVAGFDELAVINWEPALVTGGRSASVANWPHPLNFLRVEGVPGSNVELELVLSRLVPSAVADIEVTGRRPLLFSDSFEN